MDDPGLAASGGIAYHVFSGDIGAFMSFDTPVDFVEFFYTHNDLIQSGHAIIMAADGTLLATLPSKEATSPGDPAISSRWLPRNR